MDPTRLAKLVKDSGLSFRQNSKSFIFTCPLCGGKEKLYIRKQDGKFACWRCRETQGFQGAPEYALAELTGQSILSIKKSLYGHLAEQATTFIDVRFNDLVDEDELPEVTNDSEDLPSLTFPYHCLHIDHIGATKGAEYLANRGVPVDVAKKFNIRYSPEKQAIVFPVIVGDVLTGWQYRTVKKLTEEMPDGAIRRRLKAWSSDNLPRDRVFMFQNSLLNTDRAVLCEGPIDAIKTYYFGGGIAAMGKAVSPAQVNMLMRSGIKKVYVALDPDAFAEIDPLLSKFKNDIECYRVEVPQNNGKPDLGALSFQEAKDCISRAKPLYRNQLNVWLKPLQIFSNRATI